MPPVDAIPVPAAGQGKRRRGGKKGGAGAEVKAPEPAKPKEIVQPVATKAPVPPKHVQQAPACSASGAATAASATEASRRPRIAGIGGAQRQFAAALSGAGLAAGRRASVKKGIEEKIVDDTGKVADKAAQDTQPTPQAPASPGRNRGGRKRGDSAKSQVGGAPIIQEGQISSTLSTCGSFLPLTQHAPESPLAGVLQLQPDVSKSAGSQQVDQSSATAEASGVPGQSPASRGAPAEGKAKNRRSRGRGGKGRGAGEAGA